MSRLATAFLSLSLLLGACSTTPAPATHNATTSARDPWAHTVQHAPAAEPGSHDIGRGRLRAKLGDRRRQTIGRFLAYRDRRVYPINTFAPALQHVWRDAAGRLCAAATVIADDWGRDAAGRVADEDNFIKLADVHDGPLLEWILTSGLTQHEIVAIQEPMEPPPKDAKLAAREIERLFAIYTSVERQLRDLGDASLDEATDALLARPALARRFLELNAIAEPGRFGAPTAAAPARAGSAAVPGFAPPPPA